MRTAVRNVLGRSKWERHPEEWSASETPWEPGKQTSQSDSLLWHSFGMISNAGLPQTSFLAASAGHEMKFS